MVTPVFQATVDFKALLPLRQHLGCAASGISKPSTAVLSYFEASTLESDNFLKALSETLLFHRWFA
jgi:hypothetical protein